MDLFTLIPTNGEELGLVEKVKEIESIKKKLEEEQPVPYIAHQILIYFFKNLYFENTKY